MVLSKGHGSLALYAVMSAVGYFSEKELLKFGSVQSILGENPSNRLLLGWRPLQALWVTDFLWE